jgi:hypothetical protein
MAADQRSSETARQTGQRTTEDTYVMGVFDSIEDVEQAIQKLREEGAPIDGISIIGQGMQSETKLSGFVTTGGVVKEDVGTGEFFGGLFGLLAGTAFLLVPGFGPLVVLGPLASTLTGAGEGALASDVLGAILGKFVSKQQIPKYEQHVKAGKYVLVARTTPETLEKIHDAIQGSAAIEVDTYAAQAPAVSS